MVVTFSATCIAAANLFPPNRLQPFGRSQADAAGLGFQVDLSGKFRAQCVNLVLGNRRKEPALPGYLPNITAAYHGWELLPGRAVNRWELSFLEAISNGPAPFAG